MKLILVTMFTYILLNTILYILRIENNKYSTIGLHLEWDDMITKISRKIGYTWVTAYAPEWKFVCAFKNNLSIREETHLWSLTEKYYSDLIIIK
jgi:hypothetical protein